jgi:hypothetical protein
MTWISSIKADLAYTVFSRNNIILGSARSAENQSWSEGHHEDAGVRCWGHQNHQGLYVGTFQRLITNSYKRSADMHGAFKSIVFNLNIRLTPLLNR